MSVDASGRLDELGGAGLAAWKDTLRRCFEETVPRAHRFLLPAPDARTPHRTGPDWIGLPLRVVGCLGRARAMRMLDRDRRLHEEYIEWRVVRDGGVIRRVELTTELRDYWLVLAAHEPRRTLELIGELTGARVTPRRVYGVDDPLALPPEARERAFVRTFVARPNALNDGRAGICFMTHRSNDLRSLVAIGAAAAQLCTVRAGGRLRCASADEVIPLLGGAAVARRASDPVIVEHLSRLAFERRLIAFDDPVGVSIQGFEHERLRTPAGEPVPREWVTYGRGSPARRVVVEVPRGEGLALGDLVDAATEQPLRHGGQIAELVQLRLFVRTGDAGQVRPGRALETRLATRRRDDCRDVLRAAGEG